MSELAMLSATVTDLAGKVNTILERLESDQDGPAATDPQLERRVRALEAVLTHLRRAVGELTTKQSRTEAQKAVRKPWHMLTSEQAEERWIELRAWVQWLVSRNNIGPKEIPSCWYLHGGLVDELEALRWAWIETNQPDCKGTDPVAWRECLNRARARWPLFNPNGCGTTHSASSPRVVTGDRDWNAFLGEELPRYSSTDISRAG